MVVARFCKRYEVSFAPGEDGSKVQGELKDLFVALPGPLSLQFKLREGEKPIYSH